MADKYPGWSPYNYVTNNPLRKFDPDGRYGEDVHYDLTYFMAVKVMGVSSKIATQIASANQAIDDNFSTHPYNPSNWDRKSLHFRSPLSLAIDNFGQKNTQSLSNNDFGGFLHVHTDINFAHDGFSPFPGHLFQWDEPDKVAKDDGTLKISTEDMIKSVYNLMKKRNNGNANISLNDLMKIIKGYAKGNNGKGFEDIQKLIGGELREKEKDKEIMDELIIGI